MLNLFSGQRRAGDVQDHLERAAWRFNVLVLSIDIQNSHIAGDLTRWSTILFWCDALRAGRCIAVIAGPPCSLRVLVRGPLDGHQRSAPRSPSTADHFARLGHTYCVPH